MKMNLFSSFNPVFSYPPNQYLSPTWWVALMILPTLIPLMRKHPSKIQMLTNKFLSSMASQLTPLMSSSNKVNLALMITITFTIFTMNLIGLSPYSFPYTAHPQITLSLALPMWLGIMWTKMITPTLVLAHMVPQSTPTMLMPLMVVIETTSTIIQPITLSVRLMANITAGHILMSLMESTYWESWSSASIMLAQMAFTTAEVFVSMIQAYVFAMLLTMYKK